MDDTTRLREARMVFYRDDVARIDALLNELVQLSGARAALLVDREGHLVARVGDLRSVDGETVAALVAGSFAATREMARVLGEEPFSVVFHQGKRDSIQLTLAGSARF
jgi:predicted regulator of Ras-like GTPase activity (Roadblock/LC7/MglB family)